MASAYKNLADILNEMIDIAEINCSTHPFLCQNISGFPTLIYYASNGFLKDKSRKSYNGNRTTDSMIKFIKENTTNLVFDIKENGKNLDPFKRQISLETFLAKVYRVICFRVVIYQKLYL